MFGSAGPYSHTVYIEVAVKIKKIKKGKRKGCLSTNVPHCICSKSSADEHPDDSRGVE